MENAPKQKNDLEPLTTILLQRHVALGWTEEQQ